MFFAIECNGSMNYIQESLINFRRVADHVIITGTCLLDGTKHSLQGFAGGYRLLTSEQVLAELNQIKGKDSDKAQG
jgi:hypothetical protein